MSEAEDEAMIDEAALWCGRVRSGEPHDRDEFEAWLAADPRHRRAYDQAASVWAVFDAEPTAPELLALRSEALADARREGDRQGRGRLRFDRRKLVAGIAAAVVLPVSSLLIYDLVEAHEVATGTGELKKFDLPDGSQMFLDANSAARIRFSLLKRHIDLLRGRARLTVAKHYGKTFQVTAGLRTVTATGTKFTAEYRHNVLEVVLLEGEVVIEGQGQSQKMLPRQTLSWRDGSTPVLNASIDTERATSWESGQLFFENVRLADVVDRLNDYSPTRLTVADAQTGELRISGMFLVGQTHQFVDAVTAYYPVQVSTEGSIVTFQTKGAR